MCKYAWENPFAERINGVIKNNCLKHRDISTYEQLEKEVDRSVKLYNHDKPHQSLNRQTPVDFENGIFKPNGKPGLKEETTINGIEETKSNQSSEDNNWTNRIKTGQPVSSNTNVEHCKKRSTLFRH